MSSSGSGDKASGNSIKDEINQLIKDHKVMVFSKTSCPYCTKAKKILGKYKIKDYKVIELDKMENGDDYQDELGRITDADTVPRVFIDGECIGGGDDTERLEKQGELEKKLKKVNALEEKTKIKMTATSHEDQKDLEKLFEIIRHVKFAMLTTVNEDGTLHSRPMINKQADSFHGELWFFTHRSTHKITELKRGSEEVNVSYADSDHHSYVSISGRANLVDDNTKKKDLWNDSLKIWFPNGLDDPDLTLLRINIVEAEYWDSSASIMKKLYGLAKAAILGDHSSLAAENKKLTLT
ncbi:unnamed protein product [Rotaria sordida]|uniref:Glutaredoxin-2, mitochondrial n=1 Tax=Rotaria sordida TaxID=392033 RepID=A0A813P3A6_9BILA|nr:unnamed protein product [Rotaria sordida]CAF0747592.1 unnamed protein product [Rotaria sordida]